MRQVIRIVVSLAIAAVALSLAVVLGATGALSAPSKAPLASAAGKPGPRGPAGPPGPSNAYATYKDGPFPIVAQDLSDPRSILAGIFLPSGGSYVIIAKAWLSTPASASADTGVCSLDAFGDTDLTRTTVNNSFRPIALEVVHTFAGPHAVRFDCAANGDGINVNWLKIVAIKVGKLSNVAAP